MNRKIYLLCVFLAVLGFAPNVFAYYAAQFIDQSVPTTMAPLGRYPVSVTMKNIGVRAWAPGGTEHCGAFRLGSDSPRSNRYWGLARVELPEPVAPGQQVTFNFVVTAPEAGGTFPFQWRMLLECVTWFGEASPKVFVNVNQQPMLDAQFPFLYVPTQMTPGHWYTVTYTIKNTGQAAWNQTGAGCERFRLGSQNPQDNRTWGVSRLELPGPVASGQQVTARYTVQAPTTPGYYNFQWRMVQECFAWFGDRAPNVVVTVGNPTPTPTPTLTPTPTSTSTPTPAPTSYSNACPDLCQTTTSCAQSCYVDTAQGAMWMNCGQFGRCAQ